MKHRFARLLVGAAVSTGCVSFTGAAAQPNSRQLRDNESLFIAAIASLADSIGPIERMVGTVDHGIRLRIDPRPLRVAAAESSSMDQALTDMERLNIDSLSPDVRTTRLATLRRYGFAAGELDALSHCRAAEVRPPGDSTWTLPEPCAAAPAVVAGVGIAGQTSRDAQVKVLIIAILPYRAQYSAIYTFVRDGTWRLSRTSGWTIAE